MKTILSQKILALAVAAFMVVTLAAPLAQAGDKKLNIVCTTTDLASIAGAVAGELAEVHAITTGTEDPHFLQAKPSFIVLARGADLWVRIGMDLEIGWEPPLLDGARNSRILIGSPGHLDASELVMRMGVPCTHVTRGMGDVHPHGNPHYWLDPLNGRIVAGAIAHRLKELDPAHASAYDANLKAFNLRLDNAMFGTRLTEKVGGSQLWIWQMRGHLAKRLDAMGLTDMAGGWYAAMLPFRGQSVVTFHKSWVYFCRRFGLKVAAELEPKPGVPPSGSHLQKVAAYMKQHGLRLILQEPFYPVKPAEMVAGLAGAKVVVAANSVGGAPEATDYVPLMTMIVNKVSAGLR